MVYTYKPHVVANFLPMHNPHTTIFLSDTREDSACTRPYQNVMVSFPSDSHTTVFLPKTIHEFMSLDDVVVCIHMLSSGGVVVRFTLHGELTHEDVPIEEHT